MALGRGRRERGGGIEAWPGYVDALSTLLMVIIFVLLVFVLSQGFLSVALSSRDRALERLNRQVAELGELLALERGQAEELRGSLGRLGEELRAATAARDTAQSGLALLRQERDRLAADRDATRGERDRLAARIADLEATARGGAARVTELESRLAEALARTEAVGGDAARTAATLSESQRLLAAERAALEAARRDLAGVRQQAEALNRDLAAERQSLAQRQQELAASRQQAEGLNRDLAAERQALAQRQQELAASRQQAEGLNRDLAVERQARQATAQQLAASQAQAQQLTRDLAETRTARDTALRERDVTRQELEARRREAEGLSRDLAAARQTLDAARRDLAALRDEAARLDRTVQADRATIEARLSDIARLNQQLQALQALRDQLEQRAAQALARAGEEERQRAEAERARAAAEALVAQATGRATQAERAAAEAAQQRQAAEARVGEFTRLSESAQAQVALLTRQMQDLRAELQRLAAALDIAEATGRDREAQIALLGQRLNAALAARVEELQSYRSDFFGRLRRVLGDRPEVRIVGDRFVFQSEVLFPVGSAELSPAGVQQIRNIAQVLVEVSQQFPRDLGWVLRVDGHADRSPIRGGGRFADNWSLSAARSIAVAQLLIAEGLPRNRVAAAAFGDTQPLDDRDTPEAYARNRRIELRLEAGPGAAPAADGGAAPSQRTALPDIVAGLECARLVAGQGQGGTVVSGLGLRGTPARLRSALPVGTPAPRLAVTEFEGPYCSVLEALSPVPGGVQVASLGGTRLARGGLLRVELEVPAWASQVTLWFLDTAGQVVRLEEVERRAPGTRFRLGEPQGSFTGWSLDEPYGTDLVIAVASEGPLFQAARPESEPVQDFASALREAVAEARSSGRRVAAGAMVVEVVPR